MPEGFVPPEGFRPPGGPGGPGGGGGLEFSEEDPIFRPATLSFEGKTWQNVGIRYKGNSSLRSSWGRTLKMPFRFDFDEFENEYPEIKNQRFFGFKRLTLSSGFTDNSLIREKVVADIFRDAGVPAAKTAFYRLYVDYGEGSKYFGLYTMVEAPDKPMLAQQFKNAEGNLYKPTGNGAKFVNFDEKAFPKKTNENSSDFNDIKAVFSALHADRADAAKWRAGLEQVFDVDNYLNYLAVNTLIQNWDTYGRMSHNYYLYTDPSDGKVHWIPWDHNMALSGDMGGGMGGGLRPGFPATPTAAASPTPSPSPSPSATASPGGAMTGQRPGFGGPGGRGALSLDLSPSEVGNDWPLIRYIIDDPVYHARYVAYVDKARQGAFAITATKSRYQAAQALIRPFVIGVDGEQDDATLLSSQAAFESSLSDLYTHLESRHSAAETFLAKHPSP
ncbi:MAG: spore coat protein CotH [Candidatus Melainabacteria bacterium HGW-Melainabacteria-1]|nr:MAG: spore coat protein CotH [Candidatus Melainabacteria bacterium HGW-Melainabacteria-1]